MNLTIIGGGNMGSAIARGILSKPELSINIVISDPSPEKLSSFVEHGVEITSENLEAIEDADVIIIAVKPQFIEEIFTEFHKKIPAEAMVISICAGVTIHRFIKGLHHQKIVRVMPNTPAIIGEAISGWYAAPEVTETQKNQVKTILTAIGEELEVASEDLIDAVTAVSGSGPAYIFYFLEKLIQAGTQCGLSHQQSERLSLQTAIGAMKMAKSSEESLETLRENVTSKGGTTEAAINYLHENHVGAHIMEAVKKAYNRAKEL